MIPRRPRLLLLLALLPLTACSGTSEAPVALDRAAASYAATPDATPDTTPDTTPDATHGRLPDDLALDLGLDHAARWSDFRLEGPGRDVEGVPMVDFCDPDPTTWPGAVWDRMAVRESGPEYEQSREALLYPDVDSAREALEGLRAIVTACPEVAVRAGRESNEDRLHLLLRPAGEDVVTIGVHWRGVLGSGVYEVQQVGRTLIAARDLAEGSRDTLDEQAANLTASLDELVAVIRDELP